MKQRNIVVCILLSLVTCGIYALYWFVVLTNETKALANDNKTAGGGMALLLTLVTCGIYGWYWAFKMGERVDTINQAHGEQSSNSNIIYLILQIFGLGIVSYCLAQNTLNKYA